MSPVVFEGKNFPDRADKGCECPRRACVQLFLRSRKDADALAAEWARTKGKKKVLGVLGACPPESTGFCHYFDFHPESNGEPFDKVT